MEITSITTFLDYYERIRARTNRVIRTVPPDKIDWAYKPNKFTIGDMIRHIAAIERNLYAKSVSGKPICYNGCGKELADGYENSVNYFNRMHEESMAIFGTLSDADLQNTCKTATGGEIKIWKLLRSMVEHEIHHRGELYIYLSLLNVQTPPIFGLTSEEVKANSKIEVSDVKV